MFPFFKKNDVEYSPAGITVTLLGCSRSGKTSFIGGIQEAMCQRNIMLSDGQFLGLNLKSISGGHKERRLDAADSRVTTHEEKFDAQAALNQFNAGGAGGGAPAAFGSAFSKAGGGASTNTYSELKDDRDVNDLNIEGGYSQILQISDAAKKHFGFGNGFQAGTATTRYLLLEYEVMINDKVKCTLSIVDYAGEILDNPGGVPTPVLDMLAEQVYETDAVILLTDARMLSQTVNIPVPHDRCMFNLSKTRENLSADNINHLLRNLKKDPFTMTIAITQTDSSNVSEFVSENNFRHTSHDLESYIFQLSFDHAKAAKWSTGIIPVSAVGTKADGSPNVDENDRLLDDADLNPYNVDNAMLFCIFNACLQKQRELKEDLAHLDDNVVKKYQSEKAEKKKDIKNMLRFQIDGLDQIISAMIPYQDKFDKMIYGKFCSLYRETDTTG